MIAINVNTHAHYQQHHTSEDEYVDSRKTLEADFSACFFATNSNSDHQEDTEQAWEEVENTLETAKTKLTEKTTEHGAIEETSVVWEVVSGKLQGLLIECKKMHDQLHVCLRANTLSMLQYLQRQHSKIKEHFRKDDFVLDVDIVYVNTGVF
eukprot:Blabericola_migrator_1__5493@NODE_2801_length_2338_cov_22_498018_g1755_i0_p5_GENE_NODE_2801_length_2338_cov_22_498018_g1755_i0NODE_2801_length_2338_cov_22_498018_g1755_i0_p5_ORF_typecomplete_len152_score5_20Sds3/PF08598_11/0_013Sds3/PF08598_11/3_6e03LXG/PF04740_12/0_45LXG/PF04740_12/22Mating_N/PF12731_7/0_067HPPK/PF01288_20/0_21Hemerythrin/PF01814_23/9_2CLZ/PF16526_5/0_27CLZ/PF16526_5/2_8e03_NODE_2801_length_2338_cov_22_498018_g1755_i018622317